MTPREQLLAEIHQLPDQQIADLLSWVRQLRSPQNFDWDTWWVNLGTVSDDFMRDRNQPKPQQYENWCEL
jgi:hypothetical protein